MKVGLATEIYILNGSINDKAIEEIKWNHIKCSIKTREDRDFPGGPVVKTLPSSSGSAGSIPGQGSKIPHASWPKNQNIKQKKYCYKFNKDPKNGPHLKKKKNREG